MKKATWVDIPVGIASALVLGWILSGGQSGDLQAQQSAAAPSNFVGGEPERETITDAATSRLRFAAGVRSNWHHHDGGQMLMIIEGRAVTQVRGEALQEKHPNEPWWTASGVEHWHGAHPDEEAYQLTVSIGTTHWLEPVSDELYRATPTR